MSQSHDVHPSTGAENWRFICPTCGSHSTENRVGGIHDPTNGGCENFYCKGCDSRQQTLYDKKQGVEVQTISRRNQNGR